MRAVSNALPWVGLCSDRKEDAPHYFYVVGEKYVKAVADGANCLPVNIPALGADIDADAYLDGLDGILFTGAHSNLDPSYYGADNIEANPLRDPGRDATNMALIKAAMARKIPILAICRGFQEINASLGGTLLQEVHNVEGRLDHREDKTAPVDVQYGPAHGMTLSEGGKLEALGLGLEQQVNSIHGQGVDQLADSLKLEGIAPDGQIEAYSLDSNDQYLLALQFHPEWKVTENPFYLAIFKQFGEACNLYRSKRLNA